MASIVLVAAISWLATFGSSHSKLFSERVDPRPIVVANDVSIKDRKVTTGCGSKVPVELFLVRGTYFLETPDRTVALDKYTNEALTETICRGPMRG